MWILYHICGLSQFPAFSFSMAIFKNLMDYVNKALNLFVFCATKGSFITFCSLARNPPSLRNQFSFPVFMLGLAI